MKQSSAVIVKDSAALLDLIQVFEGGAAEYLPAPINDDVYFVTKLAEVVVADLAMAAAPEWERSFAEFIAKMDDANTQLQTTTRTVKVYAEGAKAATAQSDL